MTKINIDDRAALERTYPPDAFASDAAQNDDVASGVESGVRVLSAPDPGGEIAVERARRQVGEAASEAFLVPRRFAALAGSGDPDPRAGYQEFLDEIIATARRIGFQAKDTPGRGDPRIRGLRQ